MGVAAGLAGAAAAASLGSTVAGMAGGAPGTGTYGGNPNVYIPQAQPQADALYQGIFNQMSPYASMASSQIPNLQAFVSNIQNNPYAAQQMQGSISAANLAPTISGYQTGGAAGLYGAGNQVLQTAMDPQQALYNRLQQQTLDQANAVNAMSGVSGPYAAGTADQALQNFNINWQNQQLARQLQGIQGAGRAFSGASDLGGAGANTLATLGALPSQTYLGLQGTDIGSLNSLFSGINAAFGPSDTLANLLQSYMGLGQSATGLAQAGQAQQFGQNQILGSQFGQSLNALSGPLSSLFGGPVADPGIQNMGFGPSGYSPQIGPYAPQYSPILGGSAGDISFAGM